jgi:hypothetical protein
MDNPFLTRIKFIVAGLLAAYIGSTALIISIVLGD